MVDTSIITAHHWRRLNSLAHSRGYFLAGCDSAGVNAFYVLKTAGDGKVAEQSLDASFTPINRRIQTGTPEEQYARLQGLGLPFVEV